MGEIIGKTQGFVRKGADRVKLFQAIANKRLAE